MLRRILILCLPFLVVLAVGPHAALAEREWTVMVFANADNNLDEAGIEDLNEMEEAGSTDEVAIIALVDRYGDDGTKVYHVKKDKSDEVVSPVVQDLPEVDTGDWQEAVKFFKWATTNYPAKRYLFALWNHGAGWKDGGDNVLLKGVCYDDTSGNNIETVELRLMVEAMHAHIGRKVDILGYDACLMQMAEVACEVKDHVRVHVGAEASEPFDGWPYDRWLKELVKKPKMDARALASEMVKQYKKSYWSIIPLPWKSDTNQSALDLERFDAFLAKLDAFAGALYAHQEHNATLLDIVRVTQAFDYDDYKDLGDFTKRVVDRVDSAEVRSAGKALLSVYEDLVIKSASVGSKVKDSTGLSIYVPTRSQFDSHKEKYGLLRFAQETGWDEFIQGLYYPNHPVVSVAKVDYTVPSGLVSPGCDLVVKVTLQNGGMQPSGPVAVSLHTEHPHAQVVSGPVAVDGVPALGEAAAPALEARILADCPVDTTVYFVARAVDPDGNATEGQLSVRVKEPFVVANPVLLVVPEKGNKIHELFAAALEAGGHGFDTWPVGYYGSAPGLAIFETYLDGAVVMALPNSGDVAKIDTDQVAAFLDRGGRLLVTGQDVGYKLGKTPFFAEYLHARFVQDNIGLFEVEGRGFMEGVAGSIKEGDGANNQRWPDEIDPLSPAVPIFAYVRSPNGSRREVSSSGTAGICVSTGAFRVVYLAFGLEALASADLRAAVMGKALAFLDPTRDAGKIAGKSSFARDLLREVRFDTATRADR